MMNMSLSQQVPTFGDSFTITCYLCGMPSSKEWAQRVRGRPSTHPYFPFLLQVTPPAGATLREDGSTFLCAFCHASLEAQWAVYEAQQIVPPNNRKYNVQKFICAVCGVETYRKRIRALPFQEFPFLEKQRQPGSITLGNHPLAVVCLDCSETLWAQSAEYDRWGLPVSKRHFNWMARPPPPEDSVEATVARLPSGETQLPRCPPTEPSVLPNKSLEVPPPLRVLETPASTRGRAKGKGESPKIETMPHMSSSVQPSARKTSLTSTTPPTLDMAAGYHNQQPPVVTVAPMSTHTSVISLRKDTLSLPPGLIPTPGHAGPPGIYSQPAVFSPAAAYAPYTWGNASRETSQRSTIEPYPPIGPSAVDGIPGASVWPWLPHPQSELIRYQTYMSSLQNRSKYVDLLNSRMNESASTSSPSHQPASSYSLSESTARYPPATATCTVVTGSREDRNSGDERVPVTSARRSAGSGSPEERMYPPKKGSPELKPNRRSPKMHSRETSRESTSKPYPTHPKKFPKDAGNKEAPENKSNVHGHSVESLSKSARTSQPAPVSVVSADTQENVARRDCHIPKKRNWQVFMKESQSSTAEEDPKKSSGIPLHPKKKKSSHSISESEVTTKTEPEASKERNSQSESHHSLPDDSAIDLTLAPLKSTTSQALKVGAKFMIEYLCKSEPASHQDESTVSQSVDDSAPRTSVIKCAPKIPLDITSQPGTSETTEQMSNDDVSETSGDADSVENAITDVLPSPLDSPKHSDVSDENDAKNDKDAEDEVDCKKEDVHSSPKRKEESDNEGNTEQKQQGSKINADDETKNEDSPNIEQFIKETISDLVKRQKEQEKVRQETVDKQKQFLHKLGLITPEKKTELEIKSILSRHERKTLPPLKLRAETKLDRRIDRHFKELLLKVALEDPTIFQEKPEAEKCDFMAELGMKTAEKPEKAEREVKWRVVLMERVRRELRDVAARGKKNEWEKSELLKKFAECDLDSFFDSLNFILQQSSHSREDVKPAKVKKSDIQSAEGNQDDLNRKRNETGVCISYPKYVPSYALPAGTLSSPEEIGEPDVDSTTVNSGSSFAESILKIPVITGKTRLLSESSISLTGTSDGEDADLKVTVCTNPVQPDSSAGPSSVMTALNKSEPYPVRLDNLIQCDIPYWKQMKQNMDEILDEIERCKEDVPVEDKAQDLGKIRNHLKFQISYIKEIEKRLRATGKIVFSTSRRKSQE